MKFKNLNGIIEAYAYNNESGGFTELHLVSVQGARVGTVNGAQRAPRERIKRIHATGNLLNPFSKSVDRGALWAPFAGPTNHSLNGYVLV
jgi:hypothetical protein